MTCGDYSGYSPQCEGCRDDPNPACRRSGCQGRKLRAEASYFPTGPLQEAPLAIDAFKDLPHGHPSADRLQFRTLQRPEAHTIEHAPAAEEP
jgi:hypothetical protein